MSTLAELLGRRLHVLTLSSMSDTNDLLGGYEQSNNTLKLLEILEEVGDFSEAAVQGEETTEILRRTVMDELMKLRQAMSGVAKRQGVKEGKRRLNAFLDFLREQMDFGRRLINLSTLL